MAPEGLLEKSESNEQRKLKQSIDQRDTEEHAYKYMCDMLPKRMRLKGALHRHGYTQVLVKELPESQGKCISSRRARHECGCANYGSRLIYASMMTEVRKMYKMNMVFLCEGTSERLNGGENKPTKLYFSGRVRYISPNRHQANSKRHVLVVPLSGDLPAYQPTRTDDRAEPRTPKPAVCDAI